LGISIDQKYASSAWAESMGGISYPLLSDFWPHGAVAQKYGVFKEENGMSERAIFIIDAHGVIRYIDVHIISEPPDVEQCFEELAKLS